MSVATKNPRSEYSGWMAIVLVSTDEPTAVASTSRASSTMDTAPVAVSRSRTRTRRSCGRSAPDGGEPTSNELSIERGDQMARRGGPSADTVASPEVPLEVVVVEGRRCPTGSFRAQTRGSSNDRWTEAPNQARPTEASNPRTTSKKGGLSQKTARSGGEMIPGGLSEARRSECPPARRVRGRGERRHGVSSWGANAKGVSGMGPPRPQVIRRGAKDR